MVIQLKNNKNQKTTAEVFKNLPNNFTKFLPLLLLLLGAFLRLVYLGIVPGGIHQDESFSVLNALERV